MDASLRCTKCWSAHVNRFVTVLILVAKMTVMGVVVFASATSSPAASSTPRRRRRISKPSPRSGRSISVSRSESVDCLNPLELWRAGRFDRFRWSARLILRGRRRVVGAVAVVGGSRARAGFRITRTNARESRTRRDGSGTRKRNDRRNCTWRRVGMGKCRRRARALARRNRRISCAAADAYALMHLARVDGDGRVANAWTEEELARIPATPGDVATGVVYAVVYAMMWFPIAVARARLRRSEIPGIGTFLVIDYDVQTNGDASRGFTTFLSATLVLAACACAGFPYAVYASLREHATRCAGPKPRRGMDFFIWDSPTRGITGNSSSWRGRPFSSSSRRRFRTPLCSRRTSPSGR